MEPNYITLEGLEKLKEEYRRLFHEERPKLVETVAWAASNGDRSENADYIYGKRRLREIDARLRFLTGRMEKAVPVDPSQLKSETVIFGMKVDVMDEDGQRTSYRIVGEDESDMDRLQISWKSPVAKALMGRRVGDEVVVVAPSGEKYLTITKIGT